LVGKTYSSPSAYTRSKLGGVNRVIGSGSVGRSGGVEYRAGPGGTPVAKVTGSRVIYDERRRPSQRITTRADGTVVYENLKTGEKSQYKGDAGIRASDISLPKFGIKSYSEQRLEKTTKGR